MPSSHRQRSKPRRVPLLPGITCVVLTSYLLFERMLLRAPPDCDRLLRIDTLHSAICTPPRQDNIICSVRFGGGGHWEQHMRRTLGNAIVHVFDPTLKYGGVGDVHHDVAITPEKGNVTLRKTTRHGVYSYVTQPGKGYDAAVSGIPLREAVKMVGGRVAVLRLDVGGLEMLLIDEWSRRGGLDIPQVVVRFHDGPFWWRGGDRQFVTRAVQKMVGMGYDALDRVGSEYTFIRGEYNMNDDLGVGEDEDDEEENDTDEHRGHDGDEGDNDEGL